MDINCLTIQIIILLVATLSPQHFVDAKKEKKGSGKHYLCGEAFVDIWKLMCKIKKLKAQAERGRKPRSIEAEEEGKRGYPS